MTDSKTETRKEVNLSSLTGEIKVEQMFKISLSDVGLYISPHIVSVALFRASSGKNASFFLIMNIHFLGETNRKC